MKLLDQIPQQVQTPLNVATPITAIGWMVDQLPTIALILAALWSLLQIVNFFATGKHKEWFK